MSAVEFPAVLEPVLVTDGIRRGIGQYCKPIGEYWEDPDVLGLGEQDGAWSVCWEKTEAPQWTNAVTSWLPLPSAKEIAVLASFHKLIKDGGAV